MYTVKPRNNEIRNIEILPMKSKSMVPTGKTSNYPDNARPANLHFKYFIG